MGEAGQLLEWKGEEGAFQVASTVAGPEVGSAGAAECEQVDLWVRDLGRALLDDSSTLCGLDCGDLVVCPLRLEGSRMFTLYLVPWW